MNDGVVPRRPSPLPAHLGAVFTVREALAAGVSKDRLRVSDIEHPFHGVCRVRTAHQVDLDQDLIAQPWEVAYIRDARALSRVLPSGHFFVGLTAASLMGLPLPTLDAPQLQVACVRPARPTRYRGVRVMTLPPGASHVLDARGLPVCDPAMAWALASQYLSFEDRIALGDAVIRHPRIGGTERYEREPLATREELAQVLRIPRLRIPHDLGAAIESLSTQSASRPESHLRLLLAAWGFPPPHLDFDVRAENGRFLGTSEIAFPHQRVAVEYEGQHHLQHTAQWNRDIEKYHDYQAAGWIVVRVTASLLYSQPGELRKRIDNALGRLTTCHHEPSNDVLHIVRH